MKGLCQLGLTYNQEGLFLFIMVTTLFAQKIAIGSARFQTVSHSEVGHSYNVFWNASKDRISIDLILE